MGDALRQDVLYGWRLLRRSRGFAAAVIITFAVGIGANSAVFSIVDAAILRPLPYDRDGRMLAVRLSDPARDRSSDGVMPRDFLDWRERNGVFERIVGEGGGAFTTIGGSEPQQLRASRVTAGFFELVGVQPLFGRVFTEADEDPGRAQVVVLSYDFWRARFGESRDALGRTIDLDGQPYQIVGILPKGFVYPAGRAGNPLFLPMSFSASDRQYGIVQSQAILVTGRLRDGVSVASAEAALSGLQATLDEHHQAFNKGYIRVRLTPLIDTYVGDARSWMLLLLGAVTCVLLIACANVANLFIAQGTTRLRELTVRGALGATRGRLARQLLAESLVLTSLGTVAGVAFAWVLVEGLRGSLPATIPRASTIALDWRVLVFTVIVSLATGIACGLYPALHGARVDLVRGLKEDSGTATTASARQRVRYGLAWGETALAMLLLAGAGLLIVSFARVLLVDSGFDAARVVSFSIAFPRAQPSDRRIKSELTAILAAVRAQSGVEAALNVTGSAPFEGGAMTVPLKVVERANAPAGAAAQNIGLRRVSDGFLDMLRVPLHAGRSLSLDDTEQAPPVAVVNDAAVRRFWGGQSPLGQHLEIQKVAHEIVGVVGDMRYRSVTSAPVPEAFVPYTQSVVGGSTLLVRARPGTAVVPAAKAAIWSVDPNLPVSNVMTTEQVFARATAARRFNMLLLSVFAVLALVIAATGVYGVLSFAVNQRRREIGVRIALGASAASIVTMFVRRGLAIVVAGIVTGGTGAWLLGRTLESFLFEVHPRDPVIFAAVAALLGAVGLAASWLPARRAARIEPLEMLRSE